MGGWVGGVVWLVGRLGLGDEPTDVADVDLREEGGWVGGWMGG